MRSTLLTFHTKFPSDLQIAATKVAEVPARLAREGNPNLRGEAVAAALMAESGVHAAAVLVEINTTMGEISDDRVERVGGLVARSAGAAGGIA